MLFRSPIIETVSMALVFSFSNQATAFPVQPKQTLSIAITNDQTIFKPGDLHFAIACVPKTDLDQPSLGTLLPAVFPNAAASPTNCDIDVEADQPAAPGHPAGMHPLPHKTVSTIAAGEYRYSWSMGNLIVDIKVTN
jgi:hypothetical protein